MQPTEILMHEHRVIVTMLDAIDTAIRKLEQGYPVAPRFFLDAVEFIRGFADGCHHRKEEQVLFKTLLELREEQFRGPVTVMLTEHEEARAITQALAAAANRWNAGDTSARGEALRCGRDYTTLLRQHIEKEDTILFRMAAAALDPETARHIVAAFEAVEGETPAAHEKYHALVKTLTAEVQG